MNTADAEHEDGMDGMDPRASWQTMSLIVEPIEGDKITPGGSVRFVNLGEIGDALVKSVTSPFEYGTPREFAHKVSLN